MSTYLLFDERAQPDGEGIDDATCLYAFEADDDRAAVIVCRESDEYGVLFDAAGEGYRFVARVEEFPPGPYLSDRPTFGLEVEGR